MCTAAEAKTLQRVYGRYNSFFRKVIPTKRVQKPVRWYRRLTVYGNPGRVVNGCAPGIPVLICGFGVVVCSGVLRRVRRSSSFLSPCPRKQPVRTFLRSYRGTHPLGRSALSLLRCGEHPRGYPDVASGRCAGTLRQRGRERLPGKRGRTRTAPQHGKAVSSEVTSGCPKRSEGGFPVGTRTITTFPNGTTRKPPSRQTRGLSI